MNRNLSFILRLMAWPLMGAFVVALSYWIYISVVEWLLSDKNAGGEAVYRYELSDEWLLGLLIAGAVTGAALTLLAWVRRKKTSNSK